MPHMRYFATKSVVS